MLQLVERGIIRSEIKLSLPVLGGKPEADGNPDVQILRVGKFSHPKYGEFEITSNVLSEMKQNFDAKVRGVDIALDYFHDSDKEASGWLTALYLAEDGTELWGKVDWTPTARRKLQEREIRYFSPDFGFQWKDPESGVVYKNVLFGGGLTNRPFVKEMAAIVAAEEREQMKLEELAEQVKKLSEGADDLKKKHEDLQKAHADLQAEHAKLKEKLAEDPDGDDDSEGGSGDADDDSPEALKKKLAESEKNLAAMQKKCDEMSEAKKMSERETAFNVLLSEGKACVAQKEAYMKSDMDAFVKLAEKVNLSAAGTTGGAGEGTDREAKVLKLAEEKRKADAKLTVIESITLANREIQ